jgi:hypothetical protein
MKTTIEKNFSTEDSLKIIAQTMERTRTTIAKNAGKPLILWGGLVAVTSFIIYLLWSKTGSPAWNLLWFAMSAIGAIGMIFITKKNEKVPESETKRILGKIWMWFGIFATGFYLLVWVAAIILYSIDNGAGRIIHINFTLIITLLMGLCGVLSGVVMKMKSIIACCALATMLSVIMALLLPNGSPAQILVFLVLGVVALIIPGLILSSKAGK